MKTIENKYQIFEYLDKHITGQLDLKHTLANLGFMYSRKVDAMKLGIRPTSLPKMNVLISGESGTGKSYSVTKLAEYLGVPTLRIECANITTEGYKGKNLSQYIEDFEGLSVNGFGILFLDEFDKISSHLDNDSGMYTNLQSLLLGILDSQHGSKIDNCLVILGGSFQQYRDDLKKSEGNVNNSIGFSANFNSVSKSKSKATKVFTGKDWRDRLTSLGFLPELTNRIVSVVETNKLTKANIRDLVLNKQDSVIKKYKALFNTYLDIDDKFINRIVNIAYKRDNGLRELESIMFEELNKSLNKNNKVVSDYERAMKLAESVYKSPASKLKNL